MHRKCRALNAAGAPCSCQPVRLSGWCWFHDPDLATERAEGRRRGGANRSNRARAKRQIGASALTMVEVAGLLSVALRGVLSGRIEPGVGNAAASLARALTQVHEATELEDRLTALETAAQIGGGRTA